MKAGYGASGLHARASSGRKYTESKSFPDEGFSWASLKCLPTTKDLIEPHSIMFVGLVQDDLLQIIWGPLIGLTTRT